MSTSTQESRKTSFETISGTTGTYNDVAIAAWIVEGATGGSYNDLERSWLQIRTSSTVRGVNDLRKIFAIQLGFNDWHEVGVIPPLVVDDTYFFQDGTIYTFQDGTSYDFN